MRAMDHETGAPASRAARHASSGHAYSAAAVRLTGGGDAWPELVVRTEIDAGGRCAAEGNEETIGCGT